MNKEDAENVAKTFVVDEIERSLSGVIKRIIKEKEGNMEAVSVGDFINISGHIAAREVILGLMNALSDNNITIGDARNILLSADKVFADKREKIIPNWAKNIFAWSV